MLNQDTLIHVANKPLSFQASDCLNLFLLALFVTLTVSEIFWPRHAAAKKELSRSYQTNLSLFVVNTLAMSLLSMASLLVIAQQHSHHGLLRYLSNPFWQAVLSFVLLDLLLYCWHRLCHTLKLFWMFHRVHHNDPNLNTSTGFRVHLLELLLTNLLKALYIIVMGVDQLMVIVNETLMTAAVMFHHSNINVKGEKWLGRILIVPALHRTHHSKLRSEHDSNYGTVLSVWDWLFGSLQWRQPAAIGLPQESRLDVVGLLLFGFTPIKAAAKANQATLPTNLDEMIAEAAYYKAEKRNFMPGNELLDWLEAKKEIMNQFGIKPNFPSQQTQFSLPSWFFQHMGIQKNRVLRGFHAV